MNYNLKNLKRLTWLWTSIGGQSFLNVDKIFLEKNPLISLELFLNDVTLGKGDRGGGTEGYLCSNCASIDCQWLPMIAKIMVCGFIKTQFLRFQNLKNVYFSSPPLLMCILVLGLMNFGFRLFPENGNSKFFIYFVSKNQCFLLKIISN